MLCAYDLWMLSMSWFSFVMICWNAPCLCSWNAIMTSLSHSNSLIFWSVGIFFLYAMLCYAICICSCNALFFGNVILSWLPVHTKSLMRLECYRIMNLSRVMIFRNASCLCSRSALSPSDMLWFHESLCNLILSCYDLMECFMLMLLECFIVVLLQCSQLFASHVMI